MTVDSAIEIAKVMRVWTFVSAYILLCFQCPTVITNFLPSPVCEYGVGRCPGRFQFNYGRIVSDDPPLSNFSLVTTELCKIACANHTDCWFIEIRNSRCFLFSANSRKVIQGYSFIFWWTCCNDDVCRQRPERCRGFWLKRYQVYWTGRRVLQTLNNVQDPSSCREACMSIPICASINLRNLQNDGSLDGGYCEILAFDANPPSHVKNLNSAVIEWRCCPHDDGDLNPHCQSRHGKCRGRWKISREPRQQYNDSIGRFFTFSKFVCMETCVDNPYCLSVFFSQAVATCILRGRNPNRLDSCGEYNTANITDDIWYGYKWTCCDPHDNPLQPEDTEPIHFEARCVCLNGSVVGPSLLATDGCTQPLTEHNVTLNSPLAAFWLREHSQIIRNGRQWTRVFNGEIYVWVSRSLSEMSSCERRHCDTYSTVINTHSLCPHIMKRSHWYARRSRNSTKFATRPSMAILLNTACPEVGCFSDASCSDYMRQFQYYHQEKTGWSDIAYNFVVGGGKVYEGRGADVVGAHTYGYNLASIGITIVGWFEKHKPSIKSLRAARTLIRCLESRSQIITNYKLLANRDLTQSTVPGRQLYDLMSNWVHYHQSELPSGPSCEAIFAQQKRKFIELVSVSAGCGLLLVVIFMLYGFIFRHAVWCPVRQSRLFRSKRLFLNKQYPNILCSVGSPNAFKRNMHLWPTNCLFRKAATLQIHPLSTSLIILMEDVQQTCDCLRFIQLLWARCVTESLFEFPSLVCNALTTKRCRYYQILIWRESLLLLHVRRLSVARKVIRRVQACRCLCDVTQLQVIPVVIPNLEVCAEFEGNVNPFDVNCILEQRLHRFESLDSFCRIFKQEGRNKKELTYAEFCAQSPEDTVVYEFSDNSRNDSSSGDEID